MTRYIDFIKFIGIIILLFLAFKIGTNFWSYRRIKKLFGNKKLIHQINSEGFSLYTSVKESEKVLWADIDFIQLIPIDRTLTFTFKHNKKKVISEKAYYDWLILVKAIPSNIPQDPQLAMFKREYFKDLTCCKVCGKISVKNNSCLRCNTQTYSDYKEGFEKKLPVANDQIESELEYIKENQLEWFSESSSHSPLPFYARDFAFSNCTTWEPIVTVEEIKTYLKFNSQYIS